MRTKYFVIILLLVKLSSCDFTTTNSKNELNADGLEEGYWEYTFSEDNKRKQEGIYNNGLKVGKWSYHVGNKTIHQTWKTSNIEKYNVTFNTTTEMDIKDLSSYYRINFAGNSEEYMSIIIQDSLNVETTMKYFEYYLYPKLFSKSGDLVQKYDFKQVTFANGNSIINGEIDFSEKVDNNKKHLIFVVKNQDIIIDLRYLTNNEDIAHKEEIFSDVANSFFIKDKKLIPPRPQINRIDTIMLEEIDMIINNSIKP